MPVRYRDATWTVRLLEPQAERFRYALRTQSDGGIRPRVPAAWRTRRGRAGGDLGDQLGTAGQTASRVTGLRIVRRSARLAVYIKSSEARIAAGISDWAKVTDPRVGRPTHAERGVRQRDDHIIVRAAHDDTSWTINAPKAAFQTNVSPRRPAAAARFGMVSPRCARHRRRP